MNNFSMVCHGHHYGEGPMNLGSSVDELIINKLSI